MLTKLIKYEWMATSRILLPLYLVAVIMSVFTRIIYSLNIFDGTFSFVLNMVMFLYIISLVAVFAVTFLLVILRFYKNLLTGEGYLMFTLPTKVSDLINSKLILSFFWIIVSFFICFASLLFVLPAASKIDSELAGFTISAILNLVRQQNPVLVILVIIVAILGLIYNILTFYASIAIGQMISQNKVLGSVLAYVGIYSIYQFLGLLILGIGSILPIDFSDTQRIVYYIVLIVIAFYAIGTIAFYIITHKVLKQRLNLE